jgi:hypothetical protein
MNMTDGNKYGAISVIRVCSNKELRTYAVGGGRRDAALPGAGEFASDRQAEYEAGREGRQFSELHLSL